MFLSVRPRNRVSPFLRAFRGVTGGIDILDGHGTPPPGYSYGPPIDPGHLIFEQTAAQAQHDVSGVYKAAHAVNPLNPPAPADVQPSLQSTRGNVIVLWDSRSDQHALSVRLIEKCLPGR